MLRRLVGPETYARGPRPLFRAPRRPGLHHRGLARGLRGRLRPRPLAVQALVLPGRHARASRATEIWDGGALRASNSPRRPRRPPASREKAPLVIPVAFAPARRPTATPWPRASSSSTRPPPRFEWELPDRPVASLLRGFSAPVILERATAPAERAFLLAHDRDPFNKWEAGRGYALGAARPPRRRPRRPSPTPPISTRSPPSPTTTALDPAFRALALGLPSEDETIAHIAAARRHPRPDRDLARPPRARGRGRPRARAPGRAPLCRATPSPAPTAPTPPPPATARSAAGRWRSSPRIDPAAARARAQFAAADNMTERMAALALLVAHGQAEAALADFHAAWRHDRLVDRQVVRRPGGR